MDMGSIDGGFTAGQEEIARGKGRFVKLIHDLLILLFFFLQRLLKESMQDVSLQGVHEALLVRYVSVLHEVGVEPNSGLMSDQEKGRVNWLDWIRHMAKSYLTTGRVWRQVFARVSEACEEEEKEKVLGEIFKWWRKDEGVEATIEWGRWLLVHGKGREATEIVMKGMHCFDKEILEVRWREELSRID